MSRNPFHLEGQEPTLRPSVLAMMDILGYSDMLADRDPRAAQEQLRNLHRALSKRRDWLEDKDESSASVSGLLDKDIFALNAFTDNIVVGWPVHGDAEMELGNAFFKIGVFRLQLILEGFF